MSNSLDEITKSIRKFNELLTEIHREHLYVTPEVFKFLSGLNTAIPNKDIDKYERKCLIYTKRTHNPKKPFIDFYTTLEKGDAIRELLSNKPQFMFPSKIKSRYKDGILTIEGIPLDVSNIPDRMIFCKHLFGWGSKKKKHIVLDSMDKSFGRSFDSPKQRYDFYKGKVRQLNKQIFDIIGLRQYVIINFEFVAINPAYKKGKTYAT